MFSMGPHGEVHISFCMKFRVSYTKRRTIIKLYDKPISYCPTLKISLIYGLEFKSISMTNENDIKKDETCTFTVRMDKNMQEMVTYLQEKKLLNKTSIIRWSIAEAYQREKANEIKNGDD